MELALQRHSLVLSFIHCVKAHEAICVRPRLASSLAPSGTESGPVLSPPQTVPAAGQTALGGCGPGSQVAGGRASLGCTCAQKPRG